MEQIAKVVFPTCVGVNRTNVAEYTAAIRVPHMRGGEPLFDAEQDTSDQCSPHAWG